MPATCSACSGSRSLRGSSTAASSDPTSAAAEATSTVVVIPLTNACWAAVASESPAWPPILSATAMAPPTPSLAAFPASAGSPLTAASMSPRYIEDRSDPSTATPSAPPTWRAASFIAEPTPACSLGSADISASVAGVIAMPMPKPIVVSTAAIKP